MLVHLLFICFFLIVTATTEDSSPLTSTEPGPKKVNSPDSTPRIFCCLPKFTGPCRAAFIRYYYDKVTKKCKMFTFGGCMNNGNNFKTLEECQKTCRETKCPPIE